MEPRQRAVITVYAAGLLQGLSLVAVPAAASVLTSTTGYDLSSSEYGLLFLPQVVFAVIGSVGFPSLVRRFRLKRVLLAGLVANSAAMALLVASNAVQGDAAAFPVLLVATASLGLGFGLTLGSLSTYAGAFHPQRREVALTALNVLLGLGTALSPLLIAVFLDIGEWWYLPLAAAVGLAVVLLVAAAQPLVIDATPGVSAAGSRNAVPRVFWLFAAALVLYGTAETMFGNWGTTLLADDGVAATSATYALAAFWAAVTIGRLAIAVVSSHLDSTRIYVVLPWVIAVTLVVAPGGRLRDRWRGAVRPRRAGVFRVLPDDDRLRRVEVPGHRRARRGLVDRGLPDRVRPRRLRRRRPAEGGLADHAVPAHRRPQRRHGRPGDRRRPPATRRGRPVDGRHDDAGDPLTVAASSLRPARRRRATGRPLRGGGCVGRGRRGG